MIYFHKFQKISHKAKFRGGSRNLATSKMKLLFDKRLRIKAVSYCRKELHLRCCNSPRSASEIIFFLQNYNKYNKIFITWYSITYQLLWDPDKNWFCVSERVPICFQPSQQIYLFIRKTVHTDFSFLSFQFY